MESSTGPSPVAALFSFWMLLQLAAVLALTLGGIYVLYCLNRAASSLDRMASAMEAWANQRRDEAIGSVPNPYTPQNAYPTQSTLLPPETSPTVAPPHAPYSTHVSEENRL
jgi:hypothetical protein